MNHRKGITFALITAFLWGLLAVGIKIVLKEVDAITVVWVRMSIAGLCVGTYFLIKRPAAFQVFSKPPKLIWVAAIGLALNYIGYSKGIDLAGPASTQVVIQLGPIVLCLSGFFVFKEKFAGRQILGFIIAFAGLFFFYKQQISNLDNGMNTYIRGVLFTIMGALTWATYSITQKKLVVNNPVQQINLFLYTFSTIVYLPFVDFSDFVGLSPWMWVGLIFLGLNTLIAYGALGEALKYTDAGKVSVIIILNPIITFALLEILEASGVNWIAFEKIPFWAYIGAAMMLAGAALAVVAPKRDKSKKLKV
jgi:drug/metabolite transporter (DMT)-like permease